MRKLKISSKYAILNCNVYGSGRKKILAFHGFGQSGEAFEPLAFRDPGIQVFSFDLFFHGESILAGEEALTSEIWEILMRNFFEMEKIAHCELVGYSFGAKLALSTLELFPEKISTMHLLAPDGIKVVSWYKLATGSWVMRKIFRRLVEHPALYFYFVQLLRSLRLIEHKMAQFAMVTMSEYIGRLRVYNTWIGLRNIKPDLKNICHILEKRGIFVKIYLGEYDPVITERHVSRLLKCSNVALKILKSGHAQLVESWLRQYE